jgi:glycosyltransferase involved in cell wall biosynthesis
MIAEPRRSKPRTAHPPLISVIIPVYQGEKLVLGAVRSVLAQTHTNLELFVVDDGSTDSTLAVLATIDDPRLRVLIQSNSGTAAARNRALACARGAYIAFLDSDDRWFPDKLAAGVAVLASLPDSIAIAYSSYYAVNDQGRLINLAPNRTFNGMALDLLLDGEDFLMPSLCLFDRRIFDTIGHFKSDCYHEDHEFILRASRLYPILSTGRRQVVYRQSTSGKCRGILADFERAKREELAIVERATGMLTPEQVARLRSNALRSLYCRFLMYGFNRHASRLLAEVDTTTLRGTKKGLLAWVFAKSGINLLMPARVTIQLFYRVFARTAWARKLQRSHLKLYYD